MKNEAHSAPLQFLVQDALPPTKNEIRASRQRHREERKGALGAAMIIMVGALIAQALFYATVSIESLFQPLNASAFEIPVFGGLEPATQGHLLMWVLAGLGAFLVLGGMIGRLWLGVTAVVMGALAFIAMAPLESSGAALAATWVGHLVGWYLVALAISSRISEAQFYQHAIVRLDPLDRYDQALLLGDNARQPNVRAYMDAVESQKRSLTRGELQEIEAFLRENREKPIPREKEAAVTGETQKAA
ncbi:hypothetical protein [Thioalkalivibrio sp. ALE16]|uniref:hypothetical protein n=1 Tax=Thioalkalivibrio sp. ALE16 TaxID=1158172 RepID=UPI00037A6C78|nr:hypothetical protein [Thioalkalivibrio sp. ALE16]